MPTGTTPSDPTGPSDPDDPGGTPGDFTPAEPTPDPALRTERGDGVEPGNPEGYPPGDPGDVAAG